MNKTDFKKLIRFCAYWLVPQGYTDILRKVLYSKNIKNYEHLLSKNIKFKNIHRGQRCFLLCTGPSIKTQDLKLLKNEFCIAVNNFYVHKDYSLIRPTYYCLPDLLSGHPNLTKELVVSWLTDMQIKFASSYLFMSCGEKDREMINEYKLFQNVDIRYMNLNGDWNTFEQEGVNLTKQIPPGQSVSVMAIELALYMGFKDIYLLGYDHDYVLHFGQTRHFYDSQESVLERNASTQEKEWYG
ncbi:MAG: 6-hydroxymethylpterin diphosphokinase MptE-like protein, partial [Dolichospermum sp.]